MKARYIIAQRDLNPLFDNQAKREALASGKSYEHEPYIEVPVGFVEEGPLCWVHCCPGHMGSPPVCEPADDECREQVKKWMEVERPKALEQIRLRAHPDNLKKLKPEDRAYVVELAASYNLDPESEPTIENTTEDEDAEVSE